jgi:hypothetical protein
MLAAERPLTRTRDFLCLSMRPGRLGKGMSQQGGNGRHCEVRMDR